MNFPPHSTAPGGYPAVFPAAAAAVAAAAALQSPSPSSLRLPTKNNDSNITNNNNNNNNTNNKTNNIKKDDDDDQAPARVPTERRSAHSYVYDEFTGDDDVLRQHGFEPATRHRDGKLLVLCNHCLRAKQQEEDGSTDSKRPIVLVTVHKRSDQCLHHLVKCRHCPQEALDRVRNAAPESHVERIDKIFNSYLSRRRRQSAETATTTSPPASLNANDNTAEGNNTNNQANGSGSALDASNPAKRARRSLPTPVFRGLDQERNDREQERHNLQLLKETRDLIRDLRAKIKEETDPDVVEDLKEDLEFEVKRKRRLMGASI